MALLRWRGLLVVVVLVALLSLVLPASAELEEHHDEHHDEHFDAHNEAHHDEGHGEEHHEEHHEEHQEDEHHAEEPQDHQFEDHHVEVDHGDHGDHEDGDQHGVQEHHQEEEEHHGEDHHVLEEEHAGEHEGEDHGHIHNEGHLEEHGEAPEDHHEDQGNHDAKPGEADHPMHAEGGEEHHDLDESVNPELDRMTGEEHHEDPWMEKRALHEEDVHHTGDPLGHHEVHEEEIDHAGGQGEGFDFTQEDHDQPTPDELGHESEVLGHYEQEEVPMEDSDAIPDDSNCEAGPWGHWGKCSLHCGGGTQLRTREYTDPATMTGNCDWIELVQERGCNDQPCSEQELAEQDREETAEVIENSNSMFEGDFTVAYLGVAAVILVGGVLGIMRSKKRRDKDPILLR